MKSCWNCKQEVAEGSSNCPHCRVSLDESAVNMMATVGPGLAPSVQIVVGVVVNNRYEIRREIGRGGMGIVYLAFDRMMEQDVALKVIPQELCLDPNAVADLKRETAIALKLTHPNIVRLHTLDTWEGQAFVVMEYVGGGTLSHYRARLGGNCALQDILPILRQLAAALDYSHSAASAVIHRDLKPLNILLAEDGATIKVADFGLARVLRDSASRISGHDSAGTLAYMAPEQIRGKGIGRETDIYAFAAIVYEMLSGRPPFYTGDLRWQILHEEVEPIEGLPAHVNAALQRGLAKDREKRPGTAGELVALLEDEKLQVAEPKRTSRVKKPAAAAAGKGRGLSGPAVAFLILLFMIGTGFAGWRYLQRDVQPQLHGPIKTVKEKPGAAQVQLDSSFTDPTTGMEFVAVPGGCFQMGDTFGDVESDEKPVHEVCVDGFSIGKYEVTVGQWRRFISESGYRTDAEKDTNEKGCYSIKDGKVGWHDGRYWDEVGFTQTDKQPVACVSHNDVGEFLRWLKRKSGRDYRLPTEAEWEYAARSGGKKEKYAGGNDIDAVAWYSKNSGGSTHPVGGKKPNGLGLYDMSGNVWEWTGDWYGKDYYANSPRQNPAGPSSGSYRVLRGGGWSRTPALVRAAYRLNGGRPWARYSDMGFRVLAPRTAER
jgi:formylglycine-generating enzyme required for sulfatase activity